jgi:hypothetical protein
MSLALRGQDLGRQAFDLAERVKGMLSPLEDVCRYRERRSEDFAQFDVTPRDKQALPFRVAIAPGGVNIDTALFNLRELPLSEAAIVAGFVDAFLAGRLRRVTRLSTGGRLLASKTYVFDADGRVLYRHRSQAGMIAGLCRTGRRARVRYRPYRS